HVDHPGACCGRAPLLSAEVIGHGDVSDGPDDGAVLGFEDPPDRPVAMDALIDWVLLPESRPVFEGSGDEPVPHLKRGDRVIVLESSFSDFQRGRSALGLRWGANTIFGNGAYFSYRHFDLYLR